jgi:hypothetical protein
MSWLLGHTTEVAKGHSPKNSVLQDENGRNKTMKLSLVQNNIIITISKTLARLMLNCGRQTGFFANEMKAK